MLRIRFDNSEEQKYGSSKQAEQAIQDYILNSNAKSAELLQGDICVAEYSAEEFQAKDQFNSQEVDDAIYYGNENEVWSVATGE